MRSFLQGTEQITDAGPQRAVAQLIVYASVGAAIFYGLQWSLPTEKAFATVSFLCLVAGVEHRKERLLHVPMMLTSIAMDLGLVLFLEINRTAVNTALTKSLNWMQYSHILASTMAVVLYIPLLYLGYRLLTLKSEAAKARLRDSHRRIAIVTFALRTAGFFFMFAM